MAPQPSNRPIGELAKGGDLVFAPASLSHRFGRVVAVTATHVTYRSIPSDRELSIPALWPAVWNVTDRGRCLVVQHQLRSAACFPAVLRLPRIMCLPESKVQNLPDVVPACGNAP